MLTRSARVSFFVSSAREAVADRVPRALAFEKVGPVGYEGAMMVRVERCRAHDHGQRPWSKDMMTIPSRMGFFALLAISSSACFAVGNTKSDDDDEESKQWRQTPR